MVAKHNVKLTLDDIAREVWVIGAPRRHPGHSTIKYWQDVFAADKDWYVGKGKEEQENRPGPKRKFNGQNRGCIKRAAESLKEDGIEPTVDLVRERASKATVNPETGEFYDKKLILDVFKNDCYDPGAQHPWGHLTPLSKAALSPAQIALRFQYSKDQLELGLDAAWYHRHCVFVDPNYTIITEEPRAVFDAKQATKGKQKKLGSLQIGGSAPETSRRQAMQGNSRGMAIGKFGGTLWYRAASSTSR
jgi:hypothetical protein